MQLKERYNKIVSDFLFEEIVKRYDIFILVEMHISVPFFDIKNHAMRSFSENL
jgi:hypothetical protein